MRRFGCARGHRIISEDDPEELERRRVAKVDAKERFKKGMAKLTATPPGWQSAERELDAVLHLGDYLYEYDSDPDSYGAGQADAMGRTFPASNNRELITLEDYRRRCATHIVT